MNHLILLGISFSFFLIAYIIHVTLFFFFRRLFSVGSLLRTMVDYLSNPTRFFFFLVALIASLHILPFSENSKSQLEHLLLILLIATVGWSLIAIAKAAALFLRHKYEGEALEEFDKRSIMTRTQIFYRILVFIIVLLTIACILITFPSIKTLGLGILGSAGIVGIALGIAAKPLLTNMMAGVQIAFTKMLKIGDQIHIEGEGGIVEHIFLTHVIVKTPDYRRIIVPIASFIDKSFQNLSTTFSTEIIGTVFLYCDYTVPVEMIRKKLLEILHSSTLWTQSVWSVEVTALKEQTMEIRLTMSASSPGHSFNLCCYAREKMVEYLRQEYPLSLPMLRTYNLTAP